MEENNRELTITRTFDAPRDLVWKAWTDPELLSEWWGPRGVTNPVCEVDVRPEGKINIVMLAGAELGPMKGSRWPMTGTFKEITEPTKLVYTSEAIVDDKPVLENITTVTFEEVGGKTKLTLHVSVTKVMPDGEGPLQGMKMGWTQSIDKLGEFLTNR